MKYFIIVLVTLFQFSGYSQLNNPKIWYMGYQTYYKVDTSTPDTAKYIIPHGATIFDFRQNPFKVSRNGYTLSCPYYFLFDKNDSLILYSNGSKVFNGKHRIIEGADSLSFGSDWKTSPFAGTYFAEYNISIYPTAMVLVQSLSNPKQYFVLSHFINPDTLGYKLVYSLIDMSLNNGMGKMIKKEIPIKYGDFTETISATRHANGRDWWFIVREYHKKEFTILKLDSSGIKIVSENQLSGWDLSDVGMVRRNFVSKMSWNGKLFASFSHRGLELFDFDRCTGLLSNRREYPVVGNDAVINFSVCFTKDDKLLYFNSDEHIYQLNIVTNTYQKVADLVPYYDSTDDGHVLPIPTVFGFSQLAPNNKIYYSTTNGSRRLTVIDSPDVIGVGCHVKQMAEKLLTWARGVPSFPNYELGADTSCHGSGIDDVDNMTIDIYPNPASARIRIEGTSHETVIYNTLGQQVLISKDKDIDVSHLPVGVYHVLLSNRNGTVLKREKLIVQR